MPGLIYWAQGEEAPPPPPPPAPSGTVFWAQGESNAPPPPPPPAGSGTIYWAQGESADAHSGHSVLGSAVPSTGTHGASVLFNDISLPAEANDLFCAHLVSGPTPAGLTLFVLHEDGSIEADGAAGTYTFVYEGFKAGVSYGTATATLTIGAPPPPPPPPPAPLTLNAPTTGVVGTPAVATIQNTGAVPANWSLGATPAGLTATPSSGTTAAGQTTNVSLAFASAASFLLTLNNLSGGGVSGSPASIAVSDPPPDPPVITAHPQPLSVVEGQAATFTVTATGTGLAYQWRRNGVPIAGATSSSYALTAALADNGAVFSVVVSNGGGSVTSNGATLTVTPAVAAPTIVSHPASASVLTGSLATFSVVAIGTPPLAYQWRRGGVPISGATGSTYGFYATEVDHGAVLDVVVSNDHGSAISSPAALSVLVPAPPPSTARPREVFVGRGVRPTHLNPLDVAEVDDVHFRFGEALLAGESLVVDQVVASAEDRVGVDDSPTPLLTGAAVVQGSSVRVRVSGALAVAGVTYLIRCVAPLNSGRSLTGSAFLKVVRKL